MVRCRRGIRSTVRSNLRRANSLIRMAGIQTRPVRRLLRPSWSNLEGPSRVSDGGVLKRSKLEVNCNELHENHTWELSNGSMSSDMSYWVCEEYAIAG